MSPPAKGPGHASNRVCANMLTKAVAVRELLCGATISRIVEETGMKEDTAVLWVKHLERAGVVVCVGFENTGAPGVRPKVYRMMSVQQVEDFKKHEQK